MSDLVWEDPPIPKSRRGPSSERYIRIAEELQKNPGKWAIVNNYSSRSNASALRSKFRRGIYGDGIQSQLGQADDGKWNVYARYVGEPEASESLQEQTP